MLHSKIKSCSDLQTLHHSLKIEWSVSCPWTLSDCGGHSSEHDKEIKPFIANQKALKL